MSFGLSHLLDSIAFELQVDRIKTEREAKRLAAIRVIDVDTDFYGIKFNQLREDGETV